MNNPNPFLPQATLAEKQNQRRSRLKLAVSCVLAVSVLGLVSMLIGGCKRDETPTDNSNPNPDNNTAQADTNAAPSTPDTNVTTTAVPPMPATSPTAVNGQPGQPAGGPPPMPQPTPQAQPQPLPVPAPAVGPDQGAVAAGSEYTVAKGDTLGKIAKKSGVKLKALLAANPGVDPKKLKVGQKLVIPAGGTAPAADAAATPGAVASPDATADTGFETYTVKSGDTLHKIAKAHGTTVKAIQAANGMTTTAIKVGKKLKIPSKGAAAAPVAPEAAVAPVPATTPVPAPAPAPAATPAPGGAPTGTQPN